MSDPKLLKELQIKTGVVKRLVKEHAMYVKDAEKEAEKIQKAKEDPTMDEYVLKKMVECLSETKGMIPIIAGKAHKASKELQMFLEANQEPLSGSEQLEAAQAEIKTANDIPLFY
uniref:Tubulin-specific chaperone A n=1 Tax=Panagrolaimus sp. PS1159 TaxID=55785 RepID=A0AC35FA68_9BILA